MIKKILLALLFLSPVSVLAAPIVTFSPTILPIAGGLYDLGTTTGSRTWRNFYIDQICLTSDTCRTTWPSGTGGGISWPFTKQADGSQATSTTLGFFNGFNSQASSTLTSFTFNIATGTSATTTSFFAGTASTTNLFGTLINGFGLGTCTGTNAITWTGGLFTCTAQPQGTVTAIGVATANGVSGSSSGGATPNLTITLGAITPSSVTASGLGHFGNLWSDASSTLQNFTGLNSTTTNATTTTISFTTATGTTVYASNFYDTSTSGSTCIGETNSLLGTSNCVASLASVGGSLTISSPTGSVDASINLGHTNSFNVLQNFTLSSTTVADFGNVFFGNTATSSFNGAGALFVVGSTTLQRFTATSGTTTSATTTNLTLAGLGTAAGSFLAVNSNGTVIATTTPASGSGLPYPFPLATNGTSTLVGLFGGLLTSATSTIGGGGNTTGLTIFGGATTTGTSLNLASTTMQNFTGVNATTSQATSTNFAVGTLCLTADTCRTTWPSSSASLPYPFPLATNGTSSVVGLFAGFTTSATSTIGGNTTASGLTIFGGATTTGQSLYLGSTTLQLFSAQYGTTTGFESTSNTLLASKGGRVGVGTTTPEQTFTVASSSAILVQESRPATSTSQTIDWSTSNNFNIDIGTSAITFTFTNYYAGEHVNIVVCNPDAGTPASLTWPSVVHWTNQTAPTKTATTGACDLWGFYATTASSTSLTAVKIFGGVTTNFQ